MYLLGGFLIGLGLSVIHSAYKRDKINGNWEKAVNGDRETSG